MEPSSKILRVSKWAAGVAQAIQDHANTLREESQQRAEQARSAARVTVMLAVIQMGGSVVDFWEWVKALEGGEEDEEEEEEGEENPEDPKGKRRAPGENPLEDMQMEHHKGRRVEDREPKMGEPSGPVWEPLVDLDAPTEHLDEPLGSKPKKKKKKKISRPVVESSGEESGKDHESGKEQESEESEAGDYKVKEKGEKEKSGTEKSSDD